MKEHETGRASPPDTEFKVPESLTKINAIALATKALRRWVKPDERTDTE
ncbi:hypothetical protein FHW37_104587 [Neorhizobium alkalisoli]|uniref:Uncharacterized protein n=1 Tax=Neorhizobium alkalisoli TaxID=528178 RepID=A0A561QSC7_9HYPH|nr:hypothetical protein FHW37_104587 [Neorhizobium alkalisoli]